MTKIIYLTEIAHNLRTNLAALDMLGLPAAAAFIDLAINQVEQECSVLEKIPTILAPFDDPRFATLDRMASKVHY